MSKSIKRTKKKEGKTVTLVGVQIDNDLLPYLKEQSNRSRFINNLLREHFFRVNNFVVLNKNRTFASLNG